MSVRRAPVGRLSRDPDMPLMPERHRGFLCDRSLGRCVVGCEEQTLLLGTSLPGRPM
jgi:hypothetical protein